jgi:ABC-type sugar transport system substrate-binding protein
MFRIILILTVALSVLLGLTSCNSEQKSDTGPVAGKNPSGGKSRRIVFIFKVDGLLYGNACKAGTEQATKELPGVTVEYQAPEKAEVGKQIEIMQQLIAQKVDAIVLSPNDANAIAPAIKQAMDAGVKVFTWDSDAPGSQRIFYVAAADDVGIGIEIADHLAADMGGKGKVQIVSGGRGADNLNLHVKGFEQGFKKHAGITLVQPYIYNDDDHEKARTSASASLQKDPDIGGFACANSPSAPAIGEALTQLNKIGKVKVWGLALPSETSKYLKSGAVSGLILWDPSKLTNFTAHLVNDYLDSKPPVDGAEYPGVGKISYKNGVILMGTTTITKDNVDQFKF